MDKLTEKDLLILEQLTDDCGHPLWMLSETAVVNKIPGVEYAQFNAKNKKGNMYRRMTRLKELEYVYTVERNSTRQKTRSKNMPEYPYYINKDMDMLFGIQTAIADPLDGAIWKYDDTHRIEQEKYNKLKWNCKTENGVASPISDKHLEARHYLCSYIHLFFWCDLYIGYIRGIYLSGLARGDFSLLTPVPPCICGKKTQMQMNMYRACQERMRIIGRMEEYLIEVKCRGQRHAPSKNFINPVYLEDMFSVSPAYIPTVECGPWWAGV